MARQILNNKVNLKQTKTGIFKLALILAFVASAFYCQAQIEVAGEMNLTKQTFNKADNKISDDVFTEADFKLYPNPASSKINIQTDVKLKEGSILTLIDLRGTLLEKRILGKGTDGNDYAFNLEKYSPGQYFIGIRAMDGTFVTKKLIKQK